MLFRNKKRLQLFGCSLSGIVEIALRFSFAGFQIQISTVVFFKGRIVLCTFLNSCVSF